LIDYSKHKRFELRRNYRLEFLRRDHLQVMTGKIEENTGSPGFRTTYSIDDLGYPLDQLAYQLLDQAETEFVRCIIRNGKHVASVSDSYQNYINRGDSANACSRDYSFCRTINNA
jgi:hypothetical protein